MAIGLDGFGPAREFTVDDLERMPDDGRRYELLDGSLLVSPAPGVWHQEAALELAIKLRAACPPELHVVIAPFEWRRDRGTALQPDILVARPDDLLAVPEFLARPPELAVEVLSPSTRRIWSSACARTAHADGAVDGTKHPGKFRGGQGQLGELVQHHQQGLVDGELGETVERVVPVDIGASEQLP